VINLARFAVVGIVVVGAACGRNGLDPSDQTLLLDRDVALYAADAAGQDIEFMHGPGGHFGLGLGPAPGFFECESVERDGLTVTRACEYYAADGTPQTAFDPGVTDRIVMHVELSGEIDRGPWSATVDRERDIVVTGLVADTGQHVWNATGTGTMSRIRTTRDGDEVQMDMSSTSSATDVIIPVPRTSDGWPLGGTITTSVSIDITGGDMDGEHHTRDVTIVFDGTQYAEVTVNGETFTIDLANRQHTGRRGRHGHGGPGPHQ
jgi:hypothetical protein